MKKATLTEDKAEQTPTGGVLVGKREGQTIIHNKGSLSGYLVGRTHAEGGIKAVNKSTGQPLEMQGGEVVITAPAVSDQTKREFEGKMMTNREILSAINEKGGGVAFAKGGDIPKNIKRTGASYKYGGKTMTDHEIYKFITGGHLAEGMTLTQIAKMHKVSVKELQKQVDMGMKAESEHTSSKREQMKIVKDHLYENPKYYTLLKKAGLKYGGHLKRVHRNSESLVRDAKSGNTPARDLNNYNDVLDLEADGMVGADSGLFKNGGSVKPYDANMEGDSADISFSTGGAVKELVEYITIANYSDNPFVGLEKVRFYYFNDFKTYIKDLYVEDGAKNKRQIYLCINNEDSTSKFKVYTSEGKNTNLNFNPFTGTFQDLVKNLKRWSEYQYDKFDWNRWGGVKTAKTTKTELTELPDFINISDADKIKDLPQPLQDLVVYELLREGATEKGIELTLKSASIHGAVEWSSSRDGVDFWIDLSNGNLLKFKEKYGKSGEKATELLAQLKAKTTETPTADTEKIEVFRLVGLSTAYSIYGATELLKDYKVLKTEYPDREIFPYRIYDIKAIEHDAIYFGKGIETIQDLTVAIVNSPIYDKYDWTGFFAYGTKEDEKPVEQPKPSKTEKPKRNFELERKYLSQRISDLAKELELKKPILSNEEVAFYQREINSFILKLRKLNDAEMSLKPIEERVRGVYDLKISSFESEYPETDMVSINGLKSQLTEKEYFNVRTPEFKSFFGDWETAYLTDSYAGVSKAINPITKEPQPVFHGTNVLFVNWQTYETNNAHYFAVKREFSEFFATTWEERTDKAGVDSQILKRLNPNRGNFLLRCFIDVKNPIDFSRFGVEKYPIREFLTFLRVNYNIGDFDFWTNITSHSGITQDTEVYAWQIIRLWQSFTKYVKVFTTYDGYIFYEYIPTKTYGGLENASLSYCAFDSNQIKFTDAYEFNALSNDSRFDLGGIL